MVCGALDDAVIATNDDTGVAAADFSFSMSDLRRRNVDLTLFIGSGKDAVFRGCELLRHQDPSRAHVPNCSGYDQGKDS
ncbi:hypothetical protein SASPL_123534 [Salvia splendens]|uniref:Uncharacterized protein n=1 Tax=Salvia splendens TaxID=180675 RepID=A0A8X8XLL6_SALSN|nr:hypothetical protein SASPL_123534 [Salvia splendens]